jgi:hypothetical protein
MLLQSIVVVIFLVLVPYVVWVLWVPVFDPLAGYAPHQAALQFQICFVVVVVIHVALSSSLPPVPAQHQIVVGCSGATGLLS